MLQTSGSTSFGNQTVVKIARKWGGSIGIDFVALVERASVANVASP